MIGFQWWQTEKGQNHKMFSALLKEYNQINNIYNIKRGGRCKGILQYPRGNRIASYAWGLGNM